MEIRHIVDWVQWHDHFPQRDGANVEKKPKNRKGSGMKKQAILATAIFGHLFLFLFVDSLFEAPTKWKMWAFYGSSLLSVAVWAAYLIHEDNDPKGGAA